MTRSVRHLLLALLVAVTACEARGDDAPQTAVYQRDRHGFSGGFPRHASSRVPPVLVRPQRHASFHFQRPYPYHLDYYRMRYGGSYAPYFGNLYGPPAVYAPYYGGYPLPYEPYEATPP